MLNSQMKSLIETIEVKGIWTNQQGIWENR
ncbi:hypothetical protein LEP3755_33320 [Leptolyngbya sp. NIES-3755]|nr:hypothetical protein LEP3755_33320 [Leptolyngbya sp. NIES-3755]